MKGKDQMGSAATRKMAFPWWIKNDGGLNFKFPMILVHVTSCFTIQNPKSP
jgi:hypothetical protein